MNTSNNISITCPTVAIPRTPHKTHDFVSELESYTNEVYTERAELVNTKTPLLQSQETPRYENTQLTQDIAYTIDYQNIQQWVNTFTDNTLAPTEPPEQIIFGVTETQYTQDSDTLTLTTSFGDLVFSLTQQTQLKGTITFQYDTTTNEFQVMPEAEQVFISKKTEQTEVFPSTYDAYQYSRNNTDVPEHKPFAVYSPLVTASNAKEWASHRYEDNMVITTNDGWKVCVRSPDSMDPTVEVSVIELLPTVSNELQTHYDSFVYPQQYSFVPELQYISQYDQSGLTVEEKARLRTAPYYIPYGDEDALFEKLTYVSEIKTDGRVDETDIGFGHLQAPEHN